MAVSLRDKVQEQHDYLRALMESFGFYGLKFHSKTDQKPISAIETEGAAFIELAEEYNLPLCSMPKRMELLLQCQFSLSQVGIRTSVSA